MIDWISRARDNLKSAHRLSESSSQLDEESLRSIGYHFGLASRIFARLAAREPDMHLREEFEWASQKVRNAAGVYYNLLFELYPVINQRDLAMLHIEATRRTSLLKLH